MASNYKIATGSSVALVSLALMTPQPRSAGVQYARSTVSADGALHHEGAHIALIWDVLEEYTDLATLLTQFGLGSATSATVTVYCPSDLQVYTRYNGLAIRGEMGRESYFLRGIQIVIRDLVAL
jgi:hypothetical protein